MTNPFIKVTWEDVPENFTPEKIRRVKSYFEKKYDAKTVQVITKTLTNVNQTRLESLEASDNILDHQYQKKLMKDFLRDNNIVIKEDLMERLDNKVNSQIDKLNENKVRYNKWYIKKVEFSNFLSFGDNNVIDFTSLDGITVIESTPKNFGGKSTSSVDLLMFLFFNTTTKTKTNGEIFNRFTDKNEVSVRGEITIDGDDYVIERKTSRKMGKSGEYSVKNDLEFYKKTEDGSIVNLSGEQRRETEAFISSAIGTQEDFLSTILTTGYNLEELIESKPTARGQILTKFMGLESLKAKEEIAKEMFNDWSKKLVSNTFNKVTLESDNETYKQSISNSESEIERLNKDLSKFNNDLADLEKKRDEVFLKRNNDVDKELLNTNPTRLKFEITTLITDRNISQTNADGVDVVEPSQFYDEQQYKELKSQIADLQSNEVAYKYEKTQREKLIKQFEEGTVCPTCNRALDEVDHTDEIEKIKKEIEDIENELKLIKLQLDSLKEQSQGFETLKTEFETYERNKLRKERYELEVQQKQLEIDSKQTRLDNYESNKKKLEENQQIDAEVISLRTKIETANGNIRQTNTSIERHTSNISNMNEKIVINNDLIKKINS